MTADDSTKRLMKVGVATGVTLIVGLLVGPALSNWHSRQLANRLTARIAAAEDADVKVPLRQLAGLGEAAIEPLVVAAASERVAVATIARQIIEEKLAIWELLAESTATKTVDRDFVDSTAALATSLGAHVDEFGPAGKRWTERLALKMIKLTEKLPARVTPVLLENCSRVLSAVAPRGPRLRTVATSPRITDQSATARISAPEPRLDTLTRASESSLDVSARGQSGSPRQIPSGLTRVQQPSGSGTTLTPKSNRSELQMLPGWNDAAARQTPAVPTKTKNGHVVDIPTPQDMATQAAQLRKMTDEELLLRLSVSNFYDGGNIRAVLVERGFADAELALRQQLASPKVSDRLRVVEEVSRHPASTARRMLRWLLDDENAEVRLRALTALATTNSPDLKELARELAVNDDDPRVIELASRLLRQTR